MPHSQRVLIFLSCTEMYRNGEGVVRDPKKAAEWYRKAAEQGYADAQNNLGLLYAGGTGVVKDEAKAAEWYRKAAEQGNAAAQNNLGLLYVDGRGVAKDEAKAVEWYRKAAKQGHEAAQYNLSLIEWQLLNRAAEQKNVDFQDGLTGTAPTANPVRQK